MNIIEELIIEFPDHWTGTKPNLQGFIGTIKAAGLISEERFNEAYDFLIENIDWVPEEYREDDVGWGIIGKALSGFSDYTIGLLSVLASAIIEGIFKSLSSGLDNLMTHMTEMIKLRFKGGWGEYVANWIPGDDIPKSLQDEIVRLNTTPTFFDAFKIVFYIVFFDLGYFIGSLKAIFIKAQLDNTAEYPVMPPDVQSLITNMFRYGDENGELKKEAKRLGIGENTWNKYANAYKPILALGELLELARREEIDPKALVDRIQDMGYSSEDAEELSKLKHNLPGPSDLVRFMVRETYYDWYIEKYNLDAEWDDKFGDDMEKLGYNKAWAHKYWQSHWELPSMQMAFEMLHRNVLKEGDMENLFMAHDIMPHWRPKLEAISWRPFTRVDVRRMNKVGILGPDELFRAYKDIGFFDDKAQDMVDFTIKYNQVDGKELTKTDILGSRKEGLLSGEKARSSLENLGYSVFEADLLVDRVENNLAAEKDALRKKAIKKNFLVGDYSWNIASQKLVDMGFDEFEIQDIKFLWEDEKTSLIKKLTKGEVLELYAAGIKLDPTAKQRLLNMNYEDKEAEYLLQTATLS